MGFLLNRKSMIYQGLVLASSGLALNALAFCYRIVIARLAGAEGMGVYTLVMRAYSVLHSLCISGVTVGVSVLGGKLSAHGDTAGLRHLVRIGFFVFLCPFLMCCLMVCLGSEWIATLLGDLRTRPALFALLVCIGLTGFENVMKAAFNSTKRVSFPAISEICEQIIRFCAVVLLLSFFGAEPERAAFFIVCGMSIAEIFSVGFLSFCFFRSYRNTAPKTGKRQRFSLAQLLSIALPAEGSIVTGAILAAVTTAILPGRLAIAGLNQTQAIKSIGLITGMAEPLLLLPFAAITSISTVLLPAVSRSREANNSKSLRHRADAGLRVTGFIALPATLALLPMAPTLCEALFLSEVHGAILGLIAGQCILESYIVVCSGLLNGIEQQHAVFRCGLIGQSLQTICVWFLAAQPQLQMIGYALGILLGDVVRLALLLFRIQKTPAIAIRLSRCFVLPCALGGISYGCSSLGYPLCLRIISLPILSAVLILIACIALCLCVLRLCGIRPFRYAHTHLFRISVHKTARKCHPKGKGGIHRWQTGKD